MEAIIQVFHDDFHLRTLDALLEATGQLQPEVNIKSIIISFIDRFASYAQRERDEVVPVDGDGETEKPDADKKPGIPDDLPLFDIFWSQVSNTIKQRADLSIEDASALLVSLMKFSLSCYPDKLDHLAKIFAFAQTCFTAVPVFVLLFWFLWQ
jgi:vacuolar protein sorting-associated protein 35